MALLAVIGCLLGVCATATLVSANADPDRLQLILAPHPDDEFLSYAALEDSPGTYTVVVALSRGENTGRCKDIDTHLQEEAGERAPAVRPSERLTPECADARTDSWTSFLDAASTPVRDLQMGPASTREHAVVTDPRFGGEGEVWSGEQGGRVLLSLPDGSMTEDDVVEAVSGVIELRGSELPDLPIQRVLLSSYWNPSTASADGDEAGCATSDCAMFPEAYLYPHPDHGAVTLAAPHIAEVTSAEVWVNVPPGEGLPAAWGFPEETRRVTRELDVQAYETFMALGSDVGNQGPERLGLLQIHYGWLAFPGQFWSMGDRSVPDSGVLFARLQDYAVVEAP